MTETKLPGWAINKIDSKDTYDALVAAGKIGENDLCLIEEAGSGTDISLGVTGASVGDIIKVKAVDDSGKPTAWEAAKTGGSDETWEMLKEDTIADWVNSISFDQDSSGNALSLKKMIVHLTLPKCTLEDGTEQGNSGYGMYTINNLTPNFEAPSGGWDNNSFIIVLEALNQQVSVFIYKVQNNNNKSLFHLNYYIGNFSTITKFVYKLFNGTFGWTGASYKLYGVKA